VERTIKSKKNIELSRTLLKLLGRPKFAIGAVDRSALLEDFRVH